MQSEFNVTSEFSDFRGNYMELLGKPYKAGTPCADCPDHCDEETQLCTNSCPVADLWVNCKELNESWHDWLCRDRSKEGARRRKHCRATCRCENKIMLEFPETKEEK